MNIDTISSLKSEPELNLLCCKKLVYNQIDNIKNKNFAETYTAE